MSLVHEFERSGNWLFKRRSWLPVFIVIPALVYIWFAGPGDLRYNLWWEMGALAVSLLGQVIRALTIGFTPRKTSGRNISGQVAEQINITGIYSTVRHPLYLGNFFMWLGPVLFLRSIACTIIFCLLYWLYYERIMFAEEQFLRKKFGDEYDRWAQNVRSFLPSFRNYTRPELKFSLRNVLKREYNGFGLVVIIFALRDIERNYSAAGTFGFTPVWMYLLIFGISVWIVLRILRKYTRLLNVDGR